MNIKTVVLDVDGVILDINPWMEKYFRHVTQVLDLPIEPVFAYYDRCRRGQDEVVTDVPRLVSEKWWPDTQVDVDKAVAELKAAWGIAPLVAVPGSREAIARLIENGLEVCICSTNKLAIISERLEKWNNIPLSWFARISSGDGKFQKPDARVMDGVVLEPDRTLYVGDWWVDWRLAQNRGVSFSPVLTGGVPREFWVNLGIPAHRIMNTLTDLPSLLA